MKALFLTAGLGTRLQPYTLKYPKPVIPFLGLPLYLHAFDFLSRGVTLSQVIFNAHYHPDQLIQFIDQHQHLLLPVKYSISDERKQIMDSGGAIQRLQPELINEEHFWVMNGDECILPVLDQVGYLQSMLKQHQDTKALATLLVTSHPQVGKGYGGAWTDVNYQIQCFSKQEQAHLQGWHYVGVMLLSSQIFKYFKNPEQPSNILYETLTQAINQGERVQVYSQPVSWFETGVLELFKKNTLNLKNKPDARMESRLSRYPQFAEVINIV